MSTDCEKPVSCICRTCLQLIMKDSSYFCVNSLKPSPEQVTLEHKLSKLVPEVNLSVTPNAVICSDCYAAIDSAYKFRSKCLQTENQINKYQRSAPSTSLVDLAQVLQLSEAPSSNFVSVDIKTEKIEVEDAEMTPFNLDPLKDAERVMEPSICSASGEQNNHSWAAPVPVNQARPTDFVQVDIKMEEVEDEYDDVMQCSNSVMFKKDGQHCRNKFRSYRCLKCTYVTIYRSALSVHQRKHLTKKQYSFKGKAEKRKYKCDVCPFSATMQGRLTVHQRIHTGVKLLQCPLCEYRSNWHSNLKCHMRTHTGDKPFKCTLCDYRTNQNIHLQVHMRMHTGDKPFKCDYCDYKCSSRAYLKRHIRIHTGDKPFKCLQCEYRCSQSTGLRTHMRIHTGEKPYECAFCEYKCTQKSNLISHTKIHTNSLQPQEKTLKCAQCDYRTSEKRNLARHITVHTGNKPFKCALCDYSSSRQCNLKRHLIVHTGEKPFKCTECEYSSGERGNLKRHMKVHSGN